jgi:hypothetical protein
MITNVWDAYWNDQSNWDWWKMPAPEVLHFIRSLSPIERPRVLDLACGCLLYGDSAFESTGP